MSARSQYTETTFLAFDATNIALISIPKAYKEVSIVVEPLNVPVLSDPELIAAYSVEATGTVEIKLQPVGGLRTYTIPDGVIDISSANIHFLTTDINAKAYEVTLNTVAGCTHIAVTVSGLDY